MCGCYYDQDSFKSYWIVERSLDKGESWQLVDCFNRSNGNTDQANDIAIDSNNNIYVVGREWVGSAYNWIVRKSTTGTSGSFYYVDSVDRDSDTDTAYRRCYRFE